MRNLVRAALVLIAVMSSTAIAQGVAVGLKAGTTGVGLELTVGIARALNLRAGAQGFSISQTRSEFDTSYDAKLTLRSAMALLDLHPGGGGFRVSLGAYYADSSVFGTTNDRTVVTVNGTRYPVALVGTFSVKGTTNELCPYLGLGWGNAVAPGSRVRVGLDVGAYYHGSPRIGVTTNFNPGVPVELIPQRYFADLEAERVKVEEDASKYRFFPVVSLGVTIRL